MSQTRERESVAVQGLSAIAYRFRRNLVGRSKKAHCLTQGFRAWGYIRLALCILPCAERLNSLVSDTSPLLDHEYMTDISPCETDFRVRICGKLGAISNIHYEKAQFFWLDTHSLVTNEIYSNSCSRIFVEMMPHLAHQKPGIRSSFVLMSFKIKKKNSLDL